MLKTNIEKQGRLILRRISRDRRCAETNRKSDAFLDFPTFPTALGEEIPTVAVWDFSIQSQIVTCVSLAASKCVRPMSQYLPHDPRMASTLLKCPAIASVTERIPCIFGGYYSPTNWCPNICNATQGGQSQGTDLIDNLQKTVLSDHLKQFFCTELCLIILQTHLV